MVLASKPTMFEEDSKYAFLNNQYVSYDLEMPLLNNVFMLPVLLGNKQRHGIASFATNRKQEDAS